MRPSRKSYQVKRNGSRSLYAASAGGDDERGEDRGLEVAGGESVETGTGGVAACTAAAVGDEHVVRYVPGFTGRLS